MSHHGLLWEPSASDVERLEKITAARMQRQGTKQGRFAFTDQEGRHRAGVYGEVAAARTLGFETWWPTGDPFTETSDLPKGIEVRTSRRPNFGLPFAEKDMRHRGSPFVLVVPHGAAWRVVGWAFGTDIAQPRYWRADLPYPCWLMPQDDLLPLAPLLNLIWEAA